jgi:hypothetical protein
LAVRALAIDIAHLIFRGSRPIETGISKPPCIDVREQQIVSNGRQRVRRKILAGFLAAAVAMCWPFVARAGAEDVTTKAALEGAAEFDALARLAKGDSFVARIESASAVFLGKPYVLDPAGEGASGTIDRDPPFRVDVFDCQTYVETVLALARATEGRSAATQLLALRYRSLPPSFGGRLHFPEVDWIPINSERQVIRDITADVAGNASLAVAKTRITRAAWMRALPNNPTQARNEFLRSNASATAELESLAAQATDALVDVRYLPKSALSDPSVMQRIPNGSIVMIVRPMTSLFGKVGSRQSISHMGFAMRTDRGLQYRHASSTRRKAVVDRPMGEYIAAMNQTRSFAGIMIFEPLNPQN